MAKRILIVDDEETIRFLLTRQLQEFDIEADTAPNGASAAELARDNDFDLILMDVQMPIMDGLEATVRIRKFEGTKEHRSTIVALTANPDEAQCYEAGMDDYLFKPVDLSALGTLLKKWSLIA